MKILIISDHESSYIWDHFDKAKFKDIDLIISCGDLKASYLSFLVTMIPKPLYYVHGNHDTNYRHHPPEGCICIDDTVVTYNGLTIAGLGGCIEYTGGPFQYSEATMKRRTKKLIKACSKKGGLDILVTHAPTLDLGDGDDWVHKGFACFYDFYEKLSPAYHLHGHQHLNYSNKSQRILQANTTCIINGYGYYILDTEKADS
ncbi:MAG: metallophosphoesterase family protein [Cellulosilyticaceae bacterium]